MKVQRISDKQYEFSLFSEVENFETYYLRFLTSDLGKIYLGIPWNELVTTFNLKEFSKGPTSIFSPKGKIALMILKHHAGVSDHKLIEQLNSNIDYQIFCDIRLGFTRLTNFKIVSQIRVELADLLNINNTEQVLYNYWFRYMSNTNSFTTDATCYESEVRFPTDQKLLWESVDWSFGQMRRICKELNIPILRTKYLKWKKRYVGYSKMRRKTKSKRISLTRALLRLLKKIDNELDGIEKAYDFEMPNIYYTRINTIKKILEQQSNWFYNEEKPSNRIVSISKSYLRPIVRGKEIKRVEFGAKVNKLQIDGINFIEHISFDSFNEGVRFQSTVYKALRLTKVMPKIVGADAIYATNANRNFATSNNIKTDFKPKGPKSKDYKQKLQLARIITKERATRLEGSFGKEKEHYHLKKIKAKTSATEKLWIFFGIHTANALEIGRRITEVSQQKSA